MKASLSESLHHQAVWRESYRPHAGSPAEHERPPSCAFDVQTAAPDCRRRAFSRLVSLTRCRSPGICHAHTLELRGARSGEKRSPTQGWPILGRLQFRGGDDWSTEQPMVLRPLVAQPLTSESWQTADHDAEPCANAQQQDEQREGTLKPDFRCRQVAARLGVWRRHVGRSQQHRLRTVGPAPVVKSGPLPESLLGRPQFRGGED